MALVYSLGNSSFILRQFKAVNFPVAAFLFVASISSNARANVPGGTKIDADGCIVTAPGDPERGEDSGRNQAPKEPIVVDDNGVTCNKLEPTHIMQPGETYVCEPNVNNVVIGSEGNDKIFCLNGNDTICGRGGNDQIRGGYGDDTIFGEGGNDKLEGMCDRDTLEGGEGDDVLSGGGR